MKNGKTYACVINVSIPIKEPLLYDLPTQQDVVVRKVSIPIKEPLLLVHWFFFHFKEQFQFL